MVPVVVGEVPGLCVGDFGDGGAGGGVDERGGVDAKPSIQARGRIHDTMPAAPGRPVRAGHEYVRHGALALLAGLDVQTGKVFATTSGDTEAAGQQDRAAEDETGDIAGRAQPLAAERMDDALAASLRDRLAALGRAEQRLGNGTFGRSVRSGLPIPDERLEADPAAELTIEEARTGP